mmetsp:Transcript_30686/g.55185  ORF Transcript_30686/g.55185 Transcript_30686/m.55185 type:complete len:201 (-) Transcript_30686:559-1161(-)
MCVQDMDWRDMTEGVADTGPLHQVPDGGGLGQGLAEPVRLADGVGGRDPLVVDLFVLPGGHLQLSVYTELNGLEPWDILGSAEGPGQGHGLVQQHLRPLQAAYLHADVMRLMVRLRKVLVCTSLQDELVHLAVAGQTPVNDLCRSGVGHEAVCVLVHVRAFHGQFGKNAVLALHLAGRLQVGAVVGGGEGQAAEDCKPVH